MKRLLSLAIVLMLLLTVCAAYAQVDTLNVYCVATGKTTEEFNADPIAQMIQAQTGYSVKYDQAPADANDAMTAITNIFMSRSDYQAIVVNKNQFYSLLAMDALKDLTPYIEKTVNMKQVIGAFGFETASVDGKIYGVPQKDAKKAANMGLAFRQDWLEEYNAANPNATIPMPSEENAYTMSLSNFKAMLTFFKSKVPQGGSAFHVDMNGVMQESILPAFGIHQEWSEVDGKLVYFVNHPNFEAYLTFMETLFDEGLMTYQATSDNDGVVKMLQAKLLGAGKVFHWNAAAIEKTSEHELDDTIGYISVLVADDDFGDLSKVRQFANEGYSLYTVVPKYTSDEQAAAVIDWADKKLDADFFRSMVMGAQGKTYTMEDGKYYPILPAFDEQKGIADKFMNGTREEDYASYWLCRTRKTKAQDKMFSRTNFLAEEAGVKSPIAVMSPNTVFDTYFSGAAAEVRTALIQSMFSLDGRMALKDIQAVWAQNSGTEIDTAVNEWYTAWAGKDTFNTVK